MAKKICVSCGKKIGALTVKAALSDGYVCSNCLISAGIGTFENLFKYDTNEFLHLLTIRRQMVETYAPTKVVSIYMSVDEKNKLFRIGKYDIFSYENLLTYELLENGSSVTKGGLGRAVAGGLVFGAAGAIVGGVTGSKKGKNVCESMKIRVTLKDACTDTVYINLITSETKTSSIFYRSAQKDAQSCISALELIINENSSAAPSVETPGASTADEILKFKQLLDAGIITQDEFDAKKAQLLGL